VRSTTRTPLSDTLRAKAPLVHGRLCAEYGAPIPFFRDLDPLSDLVSSLLSHRTRNADFGRAFKHLRARFADWPSVRDAPTPENVWCWTFARSGTSGWADHEGDRPSGQSVVIRLRGTNKMTAGIEFANISMH
jgi:hypothetical protein